MFFVESYRFECSLWWTSIRGASRVLGSFCWTQGEAKDACFHRGGSCCFGRDLYWRPLELLGPHMGAMLKRGLFRGFLGQAGWFQAVLLALVGILVAISYMILLTTWQQHPSSMLGRAQMRSSLQRAVCWEVCRRRALQLLCGKECESFLDFSCKDREGLIGGLKSLDKTWQCCTSRGECSRSEHQVCEGGATHAAGMWKVSTCRNFVNT